MKVGFLTEFDLNGRTSGCMHLRDIYQCINELCETYSIFVNNSYCSLYLGDFSRNEEIESYLYQVKCNPDLAHKRPDYRYDSILSAGSLPDAPQLYRTAYARNASQAINGHIAFTCATNVKVLASAQDLSLVFIYTETAFSYFLAQRLIQLGVNIVPIILDPLSNLKYFFNYDSYLSSNLNNAFEYVVSGAYAIVGASEHALQILKSYGATKCTSAMAVFRTEDSSKINKVLFFDRRPKLSSGVKIVFAGQVYASSALSNFLRSLDQLSLESGVAISFDYFGTQYSCLDCCPQSHLFEIKDKGSLPYDQLIQKMADYDIGYVPYPFECELLSTVSFSFPSKLVSYLEGGVIPVFHGPCTSSVFSLFSEYGLNKLCITDCDPRVVLMQIANIFKIYEDRKLSRGYQANLIRLSTLFTKVALKSNLASILQ